MTVTLNPADASLNGVFSNGNLTFTDSNSGNASTRSTVTAPTGGKVYFESLVGSTGASGNNWCCGIANSSYVLGQDPYNSTNAHGIYRLFGGGTAQAGNGGAGGISFAVSALSGDYIGVAVDIAAKLIWYRINGGNWNNSGTANPATGVGGMSFAFTGPYYVVQACDDTNEIATLRFLQASWSGAAPSGFTEWDGTSVGGGGTVSGTGTAAGTGAASGQGQSTNRQSGTAAGVGAASGQGRLTNTQNGSAAGTSTATAVGQSLVSGTGVGSAAGSSTALAVGQSIAQALGSASGSCIVSAIGGQSARKIYWPPPLINRPKLSPFRTFPPGG